MGSRFTCRDGRAQGTYLRDFRASQFYSVFGDRPVRTDAQRETLAQLDATPGPLWDDTDFRAGYDLFYTGVLRMDAEVL